MSDDPYRYFRIEARDLLDQLARGALELERGGAGAAVVPGLLRAAHTLKGAARVVKENGIADDAHRIEDVLAPFRAEAGAIPGDRLAELARAVARMVARLGEIARPPPVAAAGTEREAAAPVPVRVVRADVEEIDALVRGATSAMGHLVAMRRSLADVERARRLSELLELQLAVRAGEPERGAERGRAGPLSRDLRALTAVLERRLATGLEDAERELGALRASAEALRLVPARVALEVVERTGLDAARALSRSIAFVGHGGDLRLDAHVAALVQAALVQIVRNAVAHGIEPPADRRARGKPSEGRIEVRIAQDGARLVLSCRDDGRGVDLEAVRAAARRRGALVGDASTATAAELLAILLRGGISTSSAVSQMSGRGIGLDLARDVAERLGGEVTVESVPGQGTTVALVLPRSLASLDLVEVEVDGRRWALPSGSIRRALRVDAAEAERGDVAFGSEVVRFTPLAACVGTPPRGARVRPWSVIVIEHRGARAALGVERLLGTAHSVVHPLPELARASRLVAGATIDEAGIPVLVLDPAELIAASHGVVVRATEPERAPLPILVVDDSLTTRMLEKSILEAAGFSVDVAASAEEGLEKARARRYACILVDVEMPGMDGFEMIAATRADPELRRTPAILVTSRGSAEDRARGEAVGAHGYVLKGEFDQQALLARIRRLVGEP